MGGRRAFGAIIVAAISLHLWGSFQAILPAQDGLKYLRAARMFQRRGIIEAVRGDDQHPLYPALIALVEPGLRLVFGKGSTAWVASARAVSILAALGLLAAVRRLSLILFDEPTANLAALIHLVLPFPAQIARETLADSLALACFGWTMVLAAETLSSGRVRQAIVCGSAAGLGFLARPELVLAPIAIGAAGLIILVQNRAGPAEPSSKILGRSLALLTIVFCFAVGSHAIVKGEVSEKLSLRLSSGLTTRAFVPKRPVVRALPRGLNDARRDFSPKEESLRDRPRKTSDVLKRIGSAWTESLGWAGAALAIWGAARASTNRGTSRIKLVIIFYILILIAAIVRHAGLLGYVSDRHILSAEVLSVPWAAAGLLTIGRRLLRIWGRETPVRGRGAGTIPACLILALAIAAQAVAKPDHRSRIGHYEAGNWLKDHAKPDEAIYDSRGWASFVAEREAYDAWHIRQALTDSHLTYLVVGDDELNAQSPRAETLRAIVARTCRSVGRFPSRRDDRRSIVHIFRFQRPKSWEDAAL